MTIPKDALEELITNSGVDESIAEMLRGANDREKKLDEKKHPRSTKGHGCAEPIGAPAKF